MSSTTPFDTPFDWPVPLRWGDADALGHINNTLYFRFMEETRVAWLLSLGWALKGDEPVVPVIANAACRFLAPLHYPGTALVRLLAGPLGRTSCPTRYEIRRTDSEILLATGEALIVFIDRASGRPTAIPETVRQLMSAASAPA